MPPDLWSGTSGPRDAAIAIVGEAQGAEERDQNKPFVGSSGRVLDEMLAEVGIRRDDCFVTNVVNERPPNNDLQQWFEAGTSTWAGLRPGPRVLAGLDTLFRVLDTVKPRVILACGNYSLWALTRHAGSAADGPRPRTPSGILDWRGSQVWRIASGERRPHVGAGVDTATAVLPLVHPAAILRDWSLRAATVQDLRGRTPLALAGKWALEDREGGALRLEALLGFDRAYTVLSALLASAEVAAKQGETLDLVCDIETWKSSLITCVGIAPHDSLAYSLPFVGLGSEKGTVKSYWTVEQESALLTLLCRLLTHPAVWWIGQNFLYDYAFLWEWFRVHLKVRWDTLVGQHLLLPGTPKDLGYLSSLYCRHHVYWKNSNKDWALDTGGDGLETHLRYNGEDCCRTYEVYEGEKRALQEIEPDGARLKLWPREMEKFDLAWSMQRRGTLVNQTARGTLSLALIEARTLLGQWLESIVPQDLLSAEGMTPATGTLWRDSPRQTAVLLYEVLGLRVQRDRKTGSVSTNDEALTVLKEHYPRLRGFFEGVLDYRSLGVLWSTFVEAKLEWNGRFSAAFNPAGTKTFRFSSSKNPFKRAGNFTNIPAGEEE